MQANRMGKRSRQVASTLVLVSLAAISTDANARDAFRIHHNDVLDLDLAPGAARGAITFPLQMGTLSTNGETVFFVLSDASDKEFCRKYGCIRSDAMADTPEAALEDAEFKNGEWTFHNDAGLTSRPGGPDGVRVPVPNPNYSPFKRIRWRGKTVIVNVPFIRWGNAPGQEMVIDYGGCDPLFRSHQPNPFMIPGPNQGGPPGCTDDEQAIERYKGGQVLDIDLENLTVTMKLHNSTFKEGEFVHYVVFDASKGPAAGFMGAVFAPKFANIGRRGTTKAVGNVIQYANGQFMQDGGPNRFLPGLTSYPGGQKKTYTPAWHITWLFYDLDGDGIFFNDSQNISRGAQPVPGSGIPGFDPSDRRNFNPFGMDDVGVSDPDTVRQLTGGGVVTYRDVEDLVEDGVAIETEGPPGLELNSPLQAPLIVNCPAPVTFRGKANNFPQGQ